MPVFCGCVIGSVIVSLSIRHYYHVLIDSRESVAIVRIRPNTPTNIMSEKLDDDKRSWRVIPGWQTKRSVREDNFHCKELSSHYKTYH